MNLKTLDKDAEIWLFVEQILNAMIKRIPVGFL